MFLDKFCNLLPVLLLRESAIHCQRLEVSAWPLVTGQSGNTRDCCGCLFSSHRLIPLINTGLLDHQRRMVYRYHKPITFCLSILLPRAGGIKFNFCQLLRWTCFKKTNLQKENIVIFQISKWKFEHTCYLTVYFDPKEYGYAWLLIQVPFIFIWQVSRTLISDASPFLLSRNAIQWIICNWY